jgi:hypothetical protein
MEGQGIPRETDLPVLAEDDACELCRVAGESDHIIPRSLGEKDHVLRVRG